MEKRRVIVVCLAALAAIVVVALRVSSSRHAAAPPPSPGAAAAKDEAAAARLASVERVVAERNKNMAHEAEVFRADGWEMVSAPPPDPRMTDLDPSLIAAGRERDLRYQLASTSASPRYAHRIAQIVLAAHDESTREAAALSLGRIHTAEAQDEIMDLLTGGKLDAKDLGRSQLAAMLRPTDLDDPIASKMASLLDSPALTDVEKQEVAFTLGLVSLRDGMELPADVTASISPASRALITDMTKLGARGIATAGINHKHED